MYSILQRDVTGPAYPRKAHLLGLGRCATKAKALIGRPSDVVELLRLLSVGSGIVAGDVRRRSCAGAPKGGCASASLSRSRGSLNHRDRAPARDARRPRSRRTCMTLLRLTKDLRIAPRANAGLGAPRAEYGASRGTRSPRASAGQNARRHGVAAAHVRIAAPQRRSRMARPGRQRRL